MRKYLVSSSCIRNRRVLKTELGGMLNEGRVSEKTMWMQCPGMLIGILAAQHEEWQPSPLSSPVSVINGFFFFLVCTFPPCFGTASCLGCCFYVLAEGAGRDVDVQWKSVSSELPSCELPPLFFSREICQWAFDICPKSQWLFCARPGQLDLRTR